MIVSEWKELGWKHPLWQLIRQYLSIRGNRQKERFLFEMNNVFAGKKDLNKLLLDYLTARSTQLNTALQGLRTEEQSIGFCKSIGAHFCLTRTQNKEHHQSSKSLVAAVNHIAGRVSKNFGFSLDDNPQKRCVWDLEDKLHVSTRNIYGAIPKLSNPVIIWEIKEYWGKTQGGSKMSDAVNEVQLVGLELRNYEQGISKSIKHLVFLDGKQQWNSRKSDLARFIDLFNQGLIDYLFIGKDVESEWQLYLERTLYECQTGSLT